MRRTALLGSILIAAGCPSPDPDPDPQIEVTVAGVADSYCASDVLAIEASLTGDSPEKVELYENNVQVADLAAPYQYLFDCSSRSEGTYSLVVQATAAGKVFQSQVKRIHVDRTAPIVLSRSPSPNETNVSKSAVIEVGFSEPLRALPGGSVTLRDEFNGQVPTSIAWSADAKKLTITVTGTLATPRTLTLDLATSAFKDLAGNAWTETTKSSWSWTLPAYRSVASANILGNGVSIIERPELAVDSQGNAIVAWPEWVSGTLHAYVARATGILGGAPRFEQLGPVSAVAGDTDVDEVGIAVDSQDRAVLAVCEEDPTYTERHVFVFRLEGSAWNPLGGALVGTSGWDVDEVEVATGPSGQVVVAWSEGRIAQGRMIYVRQWNGSGWDPLGTGFAGGTIAASPGSPRLAIDAQGRPVLAFSTNESVGTSAVHVYRWANDAWGLLGSAFTAGDAAYINDLDLTIAPAGQPAVVFSVRESSVYKVFATSFDGSTWRAPAWVADGEWPVLTFDAQARPVYAWETRPDLYYAVHARTEAAYPRTIAPHVAIPSLATTPAGDVLLLVVDQDTYKPSLFVQQ